MLAKRQHRRHGQSRPIAIGATRLAVGDASLRKIRYIGTGARGQKKNPAPRGLRRGALSVPGFGIETLGARAVEFQGEGAWRRKEAARRRPPNPLNAAL